MELDNDSLVSEKRGKKTKLTQMALAHHLPQADW